MGPQLKASLCGELLDLEKSIIEKSSSVEYWLRTEFTNANDLPFYCSVDLRNSCYKIAPVDTNLFPAGFNNLAEKDLNCTIQAFMACIEKRCPQIENILLVPENHTRNKHYLENLGNLTYILTNAGFNVKVGSFSKELKNNLEVNFKKVGGGESCFEIEPISYSNGRVGLKNFDSNLILLNNDFSSGVPEQLLKSNEQLIIPSLNSSWALRSKSNHFSKYDEVSKKFCEFMKFDPWLINPLFEECKKINFKSRQGENCLYDHISDLLNKITKKYKEKKIKKKPFVIVKANTGTYGMGVMTVRDANEIKNLNRKQRNKMSKIKEGMQVTDVLIQEGVYSFETFVDSKTVFVAEPVVYVVDRYVVGGFYRVHADRGLDENLNTPGMKFFPLPFEDGCQFPSSSKDPNSTINRLYFYGVLARLASLAASNEVCEISSSLT
ncbi:MAG: glutamate--cysteine ligase [Betaproteobacteria bacterium TMED156]|nr:MAG: glutamate--cysteine ligase [Betaproteobacteria bacterium TMED156]